jgi:hypothetical protein
VGQHKKERFGIKQACFAADFWRIVPEQWTWLSITNGWSPIYYEFNNHCCGTGFMKSGSSISSESNDQDIERKKNFTLLIPIGLHKERYRRLLQSSQENIQHFKNWNFLHFLYFCGSFLPSWIQIRIQGPHWIRTRIRIHNICQQHLVAWDGFGTIRVGPAVWVA